MRKIIMGLAALASIIAVAALWAAPPEAEARERIVATAQSFKGVPYVYGAESPSAFDCSGFVQYVYAHAADMEIPRNSKGQWAAGTPVDKSEAKPGDIFVFDTVGGGGPSHVAIYLGGDKMIHAVSEGPTTGVIVSPVTDRYFGPRCIGARYFILSAVAASPKPAPVAAKPAPAEPVQPAPAPAAIAAKPAPAPVAPAPAAPAPTAPKPAEPAPAPVALAQVAPAEPIVSQVGFVLKASPEVFMDKIPAAMGTAIAFTITNGTGKPGVFHVFFYKADVDFSKTKILREDRRTIPAGGSVEIAPYLFTEPGTYRLNVKTADNTQLMQRTWKVVDLGKGGK
jgi:cell wall-associated NlpC family hydrolase